MFDLLFPKHWSTLKKLIWLKAAALSSAVVKTVTAAIVHIKDALAGPAQNVTIAIEPVQAGTGDPSPDNVRPITGWTGANVTRAGKNLLNPSIFVDQAAWVKGTIQLSPNTTYICSSDMPSAGTLFYISPAEGFRGDKQVYSGHSVAFTTYESGLAYYQLRISDGTSSFSGYKTQLELGSTATTYEPYTGTTIPITFPTPPGTVYGGTLDVTTGLLTVTMASVDLGSLTWNAEIPSIGKFRSNFTGSMAVFNDKLPAYTTNFICSVYKSAGIQNYLYNVDGTICYTNGSVSSPQTNFIRLVDSSKIDMSAADFKAAVTGQTLCYELATPVTYQLTPQEVQLLAGENNIWADTGNTTLTYLADGRASDTEALNILLGGAYRNSGAADEATDKEALDILLGGTK